jgi:hypothetical protein
MHTARKRQGMNSPFGGRVQLLDQRGLNGLNGLVESLHGSASAKYALTAFGVVGIDVQILVEVIAQQTWRAALKAR